MVEIITESWILKGWHQSPSGRWYHPNVCKGLVGHLPENCNECSRLFLNRIYKAKGRKGGRGRHYCSRSCASKATVREQDLSHLVKFQGQTAGRNRKGRTKHVQGYTVVNVNGRRLLEHRVIMERHHGRTLNPKEVVHHRNGDRTDNRIDNLQLVTHSEHTLLHWKEGAYDNRTMQGEW